MREQDVDESELPLAQDMLPTSRAPEMTHGGPSSQSIPTSSQAFPLKLQLELVARHLPLVFRSHQRIPKSA